MKPICPFCGKKQTQQPTKGTVNLMSEFLRVNRRQTKNGFHVNKNRIKWVHDQLHNIGQYLTKQSLDQLQNVGLGNVDVLGILATDHSQKVTKTSTGFDAGTEQSIIKLQA